MTLKYTTTQIKILLALREKKLKKSDISSRYWKMTAEEREQMLQTLIDDGLIYSELRPTPTSRKTPTFYSLTSKGGKWVTSYLKDF